MKCEILAHKGSHSWQNGTLSLIFEPVFYRCFCLFIFYQAFVRFWFFHQQWIFHKQRDSTCEFCRRARCKRNMQITWKNGPQDEQLPRKNPQGTRLWHLPDFLDFYLKYVFLNITRVLLKISEFFFNWAVRLNIWIQFSKIKGKTILSASEYSK